LARGFVIEKPYNLTPKQEFADLFKKDGPGRNGFYSRYPDSGGIIQLSAVVSIEKGPKPCFTWAIPADGCEAEAATRLFKERWKVGESKGSELLLGILTK
jgi:hypothetical protein